MESKQNESEQSILSRRRSLSTSGTASSHRKLPSPPSPLPFPCHLSQTMKKLFSGHNINHGQTIPIYSRPVILSTANSRTNISWGDSLQQKHPSHTRVYAINLNGLFLDRRGGKVQWGQEHNLDTTQAHLCSILFAIANQYWERNRLCMGTSPIPVHTPYKPGGTMMMTVGSLTGRVRTQVNDKWGRWTCQVFQGKANRSFGIISAYQPIAKGSNDGKITVAAQHRSFGKRVQP